MILEEIWMSGRWILNSLRSCLPLPSRNSEKAENAEPYYEQYGDPESGELADPDQEVPYEEYQEQEVPEEEGVPEGIYELQSEEMPNDEPEIPQDGY
jgi:hypothetical protein